MSAEEFKIFVSYAHADDLPFEGEKSGWVSHFVDNLQKAIGQQPGGGKVNCWMDHRLEPQKVVDTALRQHIQESQCILAFLSPRYLESEWCQKEMALFVDSVGGGAACDRVFLVEALPTERGSWHPGIQDITALPFWSSALVKSEPKQFGWPLPNVRGDEPYWDEINKLAAILARQIQKLPPVLPPSPSPPPVNANAKTVWVADPTDDVLERWEELAAKLREAGHRILPGHPGNYPQQEQTQYRQALDGDLAQADSLVQLLGAFPGKKPAWTVERLVKLQAEAGRAEALKRKLAWLVWRDPKLALDSVGDAAHKALLEAAQAEEFEAFCRRVLDSVKPPPEPVAASGLSVVINADAPDRSLGKEAQAVFRELDVTVTLAAEPSSGQLPAQYRQHMQELLEYNDGVLIVYGFAPLSWVQAQHAWARKLLAARRKGVWGALLDGPPENKAGHDVSSRGLMVLDCRQGLRADPLKEFVEALRREAGHV